MDARVASIFARAEQARSRGAETAALQLETQAGIIRNALVEMERVKAMRCDGECLFEHAYKWRHHVQELQADIDGALASAGQISTAPDPRPSGDATVARLAAHTRLYGGLK